MLTHLFASLSRLVLIAVAATIVMPMVGCSGDNLQIVRAPFISPVVVPGSDDGVFWMNVAVKNFSDEAHGPVYLWIRAEYPYPYEGYTPGAQQPCAFYDDFVAVPALAPGESWGLADYRIDHGDPDCPCEQYECPGHLWLSLVWAPAPSPSLDGPNTSLHVVWSADGDLADLIVTEE